MLNIYPNFDDSTTQKGEKNNWKRVFYFLEEIFCLCGQGRRGRIMVSSKTKVADL
jgi:hypothetical protein